MHVIIYPDSEESEDCSTGSGPVRKVLNQILAEDVRVWTLVNALMNSLRTSSSLSFVTKGWLGKVSNKGPIYEFRVPPNGKRGVARIYWAYHKDDSTTIILLSAEYKENFKKKADQERIRQAEQRYRAL